MGKTITKSICWLLCLVLVLSMVPAVFATEADAELFDISGSSMTLGNTLEINFAIDTTKLTGTDNYIVISKEYADERGTVTKTVQQSDWTRLNASTSYVSYSVSAKEMNDKLTVIAYNADGEQLTNIYEDSVAAYCLRTLAKEEAKASSDPQKLALFVDMLLYGAAAQTEWNYNTDAMADAGLTDVQKGYATPVPEKNNILQEGVGYYGTSLSLKENILMNVAYNASQISDASYAVVTFVDHYGNDESVTVQAEDFLSQGDNLKYISITAMAVADYRQAVTVTLYDADGNAISTTVDSVESYLSRKSGALYDAIAAFGVGAYNYFHTSAPELGDNMVELSASVSVENGQVVEAASIGEESISAQIPAGVQVESNTLTLTISEKAASDSGITPEEGEDLLPLDIHIDGVSAENTTPIQVYLGQILPVGLNIGNITLYHKENGVNVPMTQVMTLDELDAHNEFYYDPITGDVTVSVVSFSLFTLRSTAAKWTGGHDYSWYSVNATEYIIANADQLWGLSQIVGGMAEGIAQDSFKGKTIKLIADIDLNDGEEDGKIFYPIGYYNDEGTYEKNQDKAISSGFKTFEGTFDGNGNTISNFYQNTWEMKGDNNYYAATVQHYRDGMGLFGKVYGGTVKNLTVKNFSSDGEYTTTGTIAAYADCGATFENIAIFNCNPRVYNIGNGGIVGCVGWYAKEATANKVTFKNITVDNSNKISALWGSWDVACGGLVGQYYPTSGQSGSPVNAGIHMENCHVAAQIDVYNDVCANYQYYAYRYAGMLIGSVRENETIDGHVYPDMTGITASGCTVHFGDWNDYYYCELVANSQASYTHDYQMSRLEQVKAINRTEITYLDGTTGTVPAEGHCNYVVVKAKDANDMWIHGDGEEYATCYHFVDGVVWNHEQAGTETVDGVAGVLVEDKQQIYREFNQLITGTGWGVTSKGVGEMDGVTILDKVDDAHSITKFAEVENHETSFLNGTQLTLGELFQENADLDISVKDANVQVFVSPVNEEDTDIRCIYDPNTTDWTQGTVTLLGVGEATVTITDYFYCEPTTITVTLTAHDCAVCNANGAIPWTVEAYTGATNAQLNAGTHNAVKSGHYYLANDTELLSTIDLRTADANVTICLNGFELKGIQIDNIYSRLFRIDNGASVTVDDGTGKGTLVPRGHDITMGSVAYVANSGSSLTISNCTINGENSSILNNDENGGHRGGAIRMDANKDDAFVTLTHVTIKNFTTRAYTYKKNDETKNGYGWGGALSVASGIVTINDCTIQDCTSAYSAAALHLSGGVTTITDTTITGCTSGGVTEYVPDVVEENAKYYTGTGAVYVEGKAVLNIEAGTVITGNTSYQEGAAICIEDSSDLEGYIPVVNMNGGDIYGNECKNVNASCGGVRVNGVFNMLGGTIHENKSGTTTSSHEILVYEEGTATISGGAVTHNDTKPGMTINVYRGIGHINGGTLNGDVNCSFPYHYDADKDGVVDQTFVPELTINDGTITGNVRSSSSSLTDAPGEAGILTINGGIIHGYVIRSANVIADHFGRLTITGGTFLSDARHLPGYLWNEAEQMLYVCEHSFENNGEYCDLGCGYPNESYVAPEEPAEPEVPEVTEPEVTEPEETDPKVTE